MAFLFFIQLFVVVFNASFLFQSLNFFIQVLLLTNGNQEEVTYYRAVPLDESSDVARDEERESSWYTLSREAVNAVFKAFGASQRKNFSHLYRIRRERYIHYTRATQLILTMIQFDKFGISRGPVKFLTCNDKN